MCRQPSPTGARCASVPSRSRRRLRVNRRRPAPNEVHEVQALLEWMADSHFMFLGYRQYQLRRGRSRRRAGAVPDTGLGILRVRRGKPPEPIVLTGELREQARQPELLIVTKANSISTVHRATLSRLRRHEDIRRSGSVIGEQRFLGLLTSSAYTRSPREIPLLRHKVEARDRALRPAAAEPRRQGAWCNVLETFPRDELFQTTVAELDSASSAASSTCTSAGACACSLRRDSYEPLLFLPGLRAARPLQHRGARAHRAVSCASASAALSVESQVQISDSALARLHMLVRTAGQAADGVDVDAHRGADRGSRARPGRTACAAALIERAASAEAVAARRALRERVSGGVRGRASSPRGARRHRASSKRSRQSRPVAHASALAIRTAAAAIASTCACSARPATDRACRDILPMLENFGLRVLERASVSHRVPRQPADLDPGLRARSARRLTRVDPPTLEPLFKRSVRRRLARRHRERRLQSPVAVRVA